tara:strand:+ start:287 stop:592 length:306 start_codon:yes stop_codon:yes gene_type:complete
MNNAQRDEFFRNVHVYDRAWVRWQRNSTEGGEFEAYVSSLDSFIIGLGEGADTYVSVPLKRVVEYRVGDPEKPAYQQKELEYVETAINVRIIHETDSTSIF